MAAVTSYTPVRSREGRRGRLPLLDDPGFRSRLIALAGAGISRRGVANLVGIDPRRLAEWLARGRALPEEPWCSFAEDYLAAERTPESIAAIIQSKRLAHLASLPPEQITPSDLAFVDRFVTSRYPEDHGAHALRTPELDPDPVAWIERNTITHGQLCAMLADPPEQIEAAQVETLSAVATRQLKAGKWQPDAQFIETFDVWRQRNGK